jgi:hypothetical protein
MHFTLFLILLFSFICMGSYLLEFSKARRNPLLVVAISFIALCTLVLFSYGHTRLNALAVVLLLVATAPIFVFLTRKTR